MKSIFPWYIYFYLSNTYLLNITVWYQAVKGWSSAECGWEMLALCNLCVCQVRKQRGGREWLKRWTVSVKKSVGKIPCRTMGIEMSGTGGMAGMMCGRQLHFFLGVAYEDKGIRHDESAHIFVVRRGSTSRQLYDIGGEGLVQRNREIHVHNSLFKQCPRLTRAWAIKLHLMFLGFVRGGLSDADMRKSVSLP